MEMVEAIIDNNFEEKMQTSNNLHTTTLARDDKNNFEPTLSLREQSSSPSEAVSQLAEKDQSRGEKNE